MRFGAIGATALIAVMLCGAASTVAADVLVIGADFDAYELGSRLPDDPELGHPPLPHVGTTQRREVCRIARPV